MSRDNVILIGMPASGKSTVGVVLAKLLGYGFVDTDILIQVREGARLSDIIARVGVERFLQIEGEVCCALDVSRSVIATGGSVVYGDDTMRHLGEVGEVLYLKVGVEALQSRLSDMMSRGVALREGQSLRELYDERRNLYEGYADYVIDEEGLSLEETVAKALEALC